jgi:hypothetical protein
VPKASSAASSQNTSVLSQKQRFFGLSRRRLEEISGVLPINVDLLSPKDVERAIAPLKDVTHIVFGAYLQKETPSERSALNVSLL